MSFNHDNQEFYSQELSDTSQEIAVCWQAISRQETKVKRPARVANIIDSRSSTAEKEIR